MSFKAPKGTMTTSVAFSIEKNISLVRLLQQDWLDSLLQALDFQKGDFRKAVRIVQREGEPGNEIRITVVLQKFDYEPTLRKALLDEHENHWLTAAHDWLRQYQKAPTMIYEYYVRGIADLSYTEDQWDHLQRQVHQVDTRLTLKKGPAPRPTAISL